jgi:hypothetical protein
MIIIISNDDDVDNNDNIAEVMFLMWLAWRWSTLNLFPADVGIFLFASVSRPAPGQPASNPVSQRLLFDRRQSNRGLEYVEFNSIPSIRIHRVVIR